MSVTHRSKMQNCVTNCSYFDAKLPCSITIGTVETHVSDNQSVTASLAVFLYRSVYVMSVVTRHG